MSRRHQWMHPPRAALALIVACGTTMLALTGCGAGQITHTDRQVAAVDGAFGDVAERIALRDVLIPYPSSSQSSYPAGSRVPVLLTIINHSASADELIAVTSPAAGQVLVEGRTMIPPGQNVTSVLGDAQPISPLIAGTLRVTLVTNRPLHAGLNTPITFQFRNAGSVTLLVPMATPCPQSGCRPQ